MFSDQILHTITGQLQSRFDSVPDGTLRAIVREALMARETIHTRADSADTPAPATPKPAETPKPVNRDAALERSRAYRDAAGDHLSQMWKGTAKLPRRND